MVAPGWSKVMEVDAAVRTEPPELLRAAMVRTARNARKADPIATEDITPLAPEQGFQAAREATSRIYETLEKLKVGQETVGKPPVPQENGRMAETAARKLTESEFQNLQTRKYESNSADPSLTPGVAKEKDSTAEAVPGPHGMGSPGARPTVTNSGAEERDAELTRMIQEELAQRLSLEAELKAPWIFGQGYG
eukprot:Skav207103  [mRNA]  locus=scaffold156:5109:10358:- [translate_table: standard]